MTAYPSMAKTREVEGITLTYPATTAYKQWVRAQLKARGWTQQRFVDEMKRVDRTLTTISTATITDFLGAENEVPMPSNSKLLPAMNKVLGIAPPPVCEPNSEIDQLVDRFRSRWARMGSRDRRLILELLSSDDN